LAKAKATAQGAPWNTVAKKNATAYIAGFIFEAGPDGVGKKPSVSRLQMLIWNFVVAFAFLFIVGKSSSLS
jgi:hypothetical protein